MACRVRQTLQRLLHLSGRGYGSIYIVFFTPPAGEVSAAEPAAARMRKRKYVDLCLSASYKQNELTPIPVCHNIVSTSQIVSSQKAIDLQRVATTFPFTSYDKKRFAAITIRLANPHCTCLLFGSGKLVITGCTSFYACILASHMVSRMLTEACPGDTFQVTSCVIQNIVAHVELPRGTSINLHGIYKRYCACATYQKAIFPGLVLRPPKSPIVLLIFSSGRIVCTGGRSFDDIQYGFAAIYAELQDFVHFNKANCTEA